MIKGEIDTYNAEVTLETLWRAAEMVRAGALTNQVMDAAYTISDAKFNVYMKEKASKQKESTSGNIRHVFDYGDTAEDLGRRLWKTFKVGTNRSQTVSYKFFESTRTVPVNPRLEAVGVQRKHVFREKASILENAPALKIKLRKAKALVYVETPRSKKGNKDGIVFNKGPVTVTKAGGGRHEDAFMQEFLLWWSTDLGAGGDLKMVAQTLASSFAFRSARVAGAKSRIANYKAIAGAKDATPEAISRANEMIRAIKKQMTAYGKRGVNNIDAA